MYIYIYIHTRTHIYNFLEGALRRQFFGEPPAPMGRGDSRRRRMRAKTAQDNYKSWLVKFPTWSVGIEGSVSPSSVDERRIDIDRVVYTNGLFWAIASLCPKINHLCEGLLAPFRH